MCPFTIIRNRSQAAVGLHAVCYTLPSLAESFIWLLGSPLNSPRSVSREISCVESKDMSHAVDNHSSGNAGIVDLDA